MGDDAPLVVPFGLTTTVSVVDVAGSLAHLADGRAPIISLDAEAEPEPTVEVTSPGIVTEAPEPTGELAEAFARESVQQPDDVAALVPDVEPVADAEPVAETEPDDVAGPAPTRPLAAPPRKLAWSIPKLVRSGRRPDVEAPAASAVSPLSNPARRAEVTMPVRREQTTEGMLALSAPYAESEPLPEIAELRRTDPDGQRDDESTREAPDPHRGNVSLIIDATTDLSAKAMRKVRRPILGATVDESDSPAAASERADSEVAVGELLIGGTVSAARRRLGLTVDELAERTRIRPFVIESIEVDDFAPCGGDFYARGHLRMLARVLGIDAEPLVATYDESFGDQPINARAVFDAELTSGTMGMVRGGTSGSNWGGLIATVLVIVLIWGVAQYLSGRPGAAPDEVAPTQNSAGLGSPGAGNRPVPPAEPRQTFVKVMARGGESRVVVADANGDFAFRGWLSDGDSTRVVGKAPLRVMAVDAGVIALRIEGRQLGLMGDEGQRAFRRIPATR